MVIIFLLVMMVLASYTTFHAKKAWYVPLALGWTVAFICFGWAIGLTPAEMALTNWVSGLLWGGGCILVISIGMAAGVAIPRLHPLFADERIQGSSGGQLAVKSLVEVPLGTVVLEEIVFRSLVLGLLTVNWGVTVGVLGSSLLFGFWHILPALEMHGSHALASKLGTRWWAQLTTVGLTVVATALAGIGFALLVVVSGSVLAPMGLHWATNSTGSVAAWLVGRRVARRAQRDAAE